MNIEKVFKRLLLAYALVYLSLFVIIAFGEHSLEILFYGQVFQENYNAINANIPERDISFWYILFVIVFFVISIYRLYKFKSYGRELFVVYLILLYVFLFFLGDNSMHLTLESTVNIFYENLFALIEGAILVFIYFTPIKDNFKTN
jgi:hypothetical protein